ncbi:hypothetical protein BX666DRAFT_2025123 [Dichotomocladium elegans]|nr:hypothetical protein BX666DRAFT_2025123 [Dichotomocladium elegans]
MNTDPAILGLDPLFFTPLKLHVRTVKQLQPVEGHKNLYLLNGHRPVRFAELCGVIVAIEQNYSMITYTIDDATDTIQCCQWKHSNMKDMPLSIGATVCICGRVSDFRNTRQITIRTLQEIDINREIMHDVLALHLLDTVYNKEFQPPENVIENLGEIKAELARQANEESWFCEPADSTLEDTKDEIYFAKEMLSFLKSVVPHQAFSKTMPHSSKRLRDMACEIVRSHVCRRMYTFALV